MLFGLVQHVEHEEGGKQRTLARRRVAEQRDPGDEPDDGKRGQGLLPAGGDDGEEGHGCKVLQVAA